MKLLIVDDEELTRTGVISSLDLSLIHILSPFTSAIVAYAESFPRPSISHR